MGSTGQKALIPVRDFLMASLKRFILRTIRRVFGTEQIVDILRSNRDLEAEVNRLRDEKYAAIHAATVQTVLCSSPESWFECIFNGTRMWLPKHTLRIMVKGMYGRVDGPFEIEAETAHTKWLSARSKPGTIFLDVGAATGTMTLPIGLRVPGIKIISFEPSRTANRVLRTTLERNGVTCAEVQDAAISDAVGKASFNEMGFDPTGQNHFMPEVSALASSDSNHPLQIAKYDVPVTTLDAFFSTRTDASLVRTVKIDVEGFETKVLQGAGKLLREARPYLAIDIHTDPFGDGTTERGVRSILQALGYQFEKMGHVLLCYPPNAT